MAGVTAPPEPGGVHLWTPAGLSPTADLAPHEIRTLARSGQPGSAMPKEPWAVVVTDTDGAVAAAVSPAFPAGLFWAVAGNRLVFADTVRALVDALAPQVSLDPQFIREFALIPYNTPGTATAFKEIHRIQPGTTAVWPTGSNMARTDPRVVEWCGPQVWKEARPLEGPGTAQRYLAAFDQGVDELLASGPLYTHMSGGLDSTFVAASLVRHATPDNPVHALCYSPLSEANLTSSGNWDPDDYPIAKAMEAAYPGRLVVHRVVIDPDAQPLDAAAAAAEATGVPTFNPANQLWLAKTAAIAAAAGAVRLFSGQNGNAAFSYFHQYAPAYYLRSGHPLTAWRSVQPDARGLPDRAALRRRVVGPLAQQVRRKAPIADPKWWRQLRRRTALGHDTESVDPLDYEALAGVARWATPASPPMDRDRYLSWLAGRNPLQAARTFSTSATPVVDPFTTTIVLDTAAAISPLEWSRGPGPRGYARLLGAGRVPDSIRLRTRRGGQAWDEWYLIRNQRERYYDEVAALPDTPILGGWVDDAALRQHLDSWPWGQVHGPHRLAVLAMGRILSLAAFVRAATRWTRG